MATQSAVQFRLSGGATNTAAALSLGGAISNHSLRSQYATATSGIAGITFIDAAGNTEGAGLLSYTASNQSLTWTPNGGAAGSPIAIGGGGLLAIPAGASRGYYIVNVVPVQLPTADAAINPVIANLTDTALPDAVPSTTGYYCLYLYVLAALTNVTLKLQQPVRGGALSMGLDPVGLSADATAITDVTTAPGGVTFDVVDIAIGNMTANSYQAIWLKRVAGDSPTDAIASLQVCFD